MEIAINGAVYTPEKLQQVANNCFDRTAFAKTLGFTYYNGKLSKKITEIVERLGISIAHFDAAKKNKERRHYPIINKICPICAIQFETLTGHPKEKVTCSSACSNTYFADSKHTEESNKKRSVAMIEHHIAAGNNIRIPGVPRPRLPKNSKAIFIKTCSICSKEFRSLNKRQVCCSRECANKLSSITAKQRVANGTHQGWASRDKLKPSFPEKVTMEILLELNCQSYMREMKIGKWFIDFAFTDKMIALEIDGKQHTYSDRIVKDAEKDTFLQSQGWQVHRVQWKKLTSQSRIELKNKLISILGLEK